MFVQQTETCRLFKVSVVLPDLGWCLRPPQPPDVSQMSARQERLCVTVAAALTAGARSPSCSASAGSTLSDTDVRPAADANATVCSCEPGPSDQRRPRSWGTRAGPSLRWGLVLSEPVPSGLPSSVRTSACPAPVQMSDVYYFLVWLRRLLIFGPSISTHISIHSIIFTTYF